MTTFESKYGTYIKNLHVKSLIMVEINRYKIENNNIQVMYTLSKIISTYKLFIQRQIKKQK